MSANSEHDDLFPRNDATNREPQPQGSLLKRLLTRAGLMAENGNNGNGVKVPQWAAPVLLGTLLSGGWFFFSDMRSEMRDNNKAVIEEMRRMSNEILILKTQKDDAEKQRERESKAAQEEKDLNRLWRENIDKEIARMQLRTGDK